MQNKVSGISYRRVNFKDDAEMLFIADTDTRIPAKFDDEFPTDEKMILDRLKHFKEKLNEEDFFDVAVVGKDESLGFMLLKSIRILIIKISAMFILCGLIPNSVEVE